MAKAVKKLKAVAVKEAVKPAVVPAEKPQTQVPADPKVMIKTSNMALSAKLQNAGKPVTAITGGIIGDDKTHYFKTNLAACRELTKDGNRLLSESELKLLVEVKEVTPSKVLYTDLKENLSAGKPRK